MPHYYFYVMTSEFLIIIMFEVMAINNVVINIITADDLLIEVLEIIAASK